MDEHNTTIATYDRCARNFADTFMDNDLYWASLDRFAARLEPGSRLLDLGCGPGNNARYLAGRVPDLKIVGVDLASAMLAIAREAVPQGEFRQGDIRDLDPSEGPYDAILAAMCLPYLDKNEAQAFIQNLGKLLTHHGRLYLSCMEGRGSGYETASFSEGHPIFVHYYAQEEVSAWLETACLRVDEVIRQEYPEPDGSITIDMIFLSEERI
jgi:cyclopropane fatty-acyl-phospholipid synthase-like methyltransferase